MTSALSIPCSCCRVETDNPYLCDGRLEDGRTCNVALCANCVEHVTTVNLRSNRPEVEDTVDRCPACKAANRETNFGGYVLERALQLLGKNRDGSPMTKLESQLFDRFGHLPEPPY